MPRSKPPVPRVRVFAGPNGSGKSTVVQSVTNELGKYHIGPFVNADVIESEFRNSGRLGLAQYGLSMSTETLQDHLRNASILSKSADTWRKYACRKGSIVLQTRKVDSYASAAIAELLRRELLKARKHFSFETVFSHESKIQFMKDASALGFRVYLYFVATEDVQINVARVAERVRLGGHSVPEQKIVSRYGRSLALLRQAVAETYRSFFFDNSGQRAILFAERLPSGKLRRQRNRQGVVPMPQWFKHSYLDH